MELQKLNTYAATYRLHHDNESFNVLYAQADQLFGPVNRSVVKRSGLGDESDADSIFHNVILKLAMRDDVRDFGKTLSAALRKGRLHYFRTETRRRKRTVCSLDETYNDIDGAPTPKYIVPTNAGSAEVEAFSIKKETDQHQLIDFLLDRANDPITTLIVTKLKEEEDCSKMSITALAKALGLHHETATRKLRSLVKHYDANRFGDYHEYLAV